MRRLILLSFVISLMSASTALAQTAQQLPFPTRTPTTTPDPNATPVRDVTFSEVGWMGTEASAYDEYIELRGGADISLRNWYLIIDGELIELENNIGANGYYLIERTDDETVSDYTADLIASFSLPNTGADVRLYQNNVLQDVLTEWHAGSSSPRRAMEWNGSAWTTNDGVHRAGLDANGQPISGSPGRAFVASNEPTATALPPTPTASPTWDPTQPTPTIPPFPFPTRTPTTGAAQPTATATIAAPDYTVYLPILLKGE